jgi:hypothetical protein
MAQSLVREIFDGSPLQALSVLIAAPIKIHQDISNRSRAFQAFGQCTEKRVYSLLPFL